MPKMKTNRAAAKRFKVKKSGKIKRAKAYKSHILNNESKRPKRKRKLRQSTYAVPANEKAIKRMLGK